MNGIVMAFWPKICFAVKDRCTGVGLQLNLQIIITGIKDTPSQNRIGEKDEYHFENRVLKIFYLGIFVLIFTLLVEIHAKSS